MVTKEEAIITLKEYERLNPRGVYRHYKGGLYTLFAVTLDEESLLPMGHYYSPSNRVRWSRRFANFAGLVVGTDGTLGVKRFVFEREATREEMAEAWDFR